MKLQVYSVFDNKSCVFGHPFFMVNDATMIREFKNAVNDSRSKFSVNPEDFSLYRIGSFEDSVGRLEHESQPVALITASACVVVKPGSVEVVEKVEKGA